MDPRQGTSQGQAWALWGPEPCGLFPSFVLCPFDDALGKPSHTSDFIHKGKPHTQPWPTPHLFLMTYVTLFRFVC